MDASSSAHGAAAAASSSSSRSSNCRKYEVFLSFRGVDTRKTFTDHLLIALRNAGINTFIDNQLRRGENIQSELDREIERSRIAVIVFSKRYAESRWCLRELSKIMRCEKKVCPIFYDVNPSQVRKQTDSFEKAFQKHEKDVDPTVVKQWREDLKASANLVGWNLKTTADRHEGVFIKKIVEDIKELLKTTDFKNTKHSDVRMLEFSTKYSGVEGLPNSLLLPKANNWTALEIMSDFSEMSKMRILLLKDCSKLKDIPNLDNSLDHMYSIIMKGCTSLTDTFKENLRTKNAFGGIFLSGNDIGGLALGIVYSADNSDSTGSLCIDVVNRTQRTKFRIWPMKAAVTASHEYYLWLGNLSNKKLNLKGCDIVLVKENFYGGDNRIRVNKTKPGVDMVKWDTQLDIRHVFFCYKTPEAWPWCINDSKSNRLPKFFTSALKARKNDITFKTSMTVIEGHEGTEFSDGNVLIFPQMIKYRGLKESDVDSFVDDVLVNHKPWASRVQEQLTGSHVFVCTHCSREEWNGDSARVLIDKFKEEAELRGLTNQVFVTACYHTGGHKYAGTLTIYSPDSNGSMTDHWYRFVTPDDVPKLLDKDIGKGEIIERHWRGQIRESCARKDALGKLSSLIGNWEQSDVLTAAAVVGAVATVAVAYSFYRRSG